MNISNCKYVTRFYYSDRLFSQVIRHFLSFFAARILKKPHIHWPYPDDYTNTSFDALFDTCKIIESADTYDAVLNLMRSQEVDCWCDQTIANHFAIEDLFSSENIQLMRDAYHFKTHTPSFDPTMKLNVAVHIRRGDIARYTTESRYTHMDFFTNYMTQIHSLYPYAQFHVYSDSDVDVPVSDKSISITYHILEDLLQTIHDMIHADILLMSIGSNMSFFAGLMSKGIVFLDKRKLDEPFNAEYNRYWCNHTKFILQEEIFLQRVLDLSD